MSQEMAESHGWSTLPSRGSRVVVTGALGGLGRGLTQALGDLGAAVVGFDHPDALSSAVSSDGDVLAADITDPSAVRDAVDTAADRLGGIDAVIGAAGVVDTIHRAATFSDEAFASDLEANLSGQFALARSAFPHLRQAESPAIVFVASQAGLDGLPGQVSYAASKAGLIGLTTSLASEWVGEGIRVNAVAPGMFGTPKVLAMPASARDRMLTTVPMGRIGTVDEVVGPILFLLSPAAGYITGRTLRLDGGAGLAMTGLFR
jgi:NAD(P)-dependent dehydrogenase (short-subunit alcohol dehydrogenase family)